MYIDNHTTQAEADAIIAEVEQAKRQSIFAPWILATITPPPKGESILCWLLVTDPATVHRDTHDKLWNFAGMTLIGPIIDVDYPGRIVPGVKGRPIVLWQPIDKLPKGATKHVQSETI